MEMVVLGGWHHHCCCCCCDLVRALLCTFIYRAQWSRRFYLPKDVATTKGGIRGLKPWFTQREVFIGVTRIVKDDPSKKIYECVSDFSGNTRAYVFQATGEMGRRQGRCDRPRSHRTSSNHHLQYDTNDAFGHLSVPHDCFFELFSLLFSSFSDLPRVIKLFHFDVFVANALTAPPYILQFILTLIMIHNSDRMHERGLHGAFGCTSPSRPISLACS